MKRLRYNLRCMHCGNFMYYIFTEDTYKCGACGFTWMIKDGKSEES